jgi:hypothetical protein
MGKAKIILPCISQTLDDTDMKLGIVDYTHHAKSGRNLPGGECVDEIYAHLSSFFVCFSVGSPSTNDSLI